METKTILVYVVIVALVIGVPWVIDIFMAYIATYKIRKLLIEQAAKDRLSAAELKEMLKEISKAPGGIQGLSRASMALSVILVLAIAVFHLLTKEKPTDGDSQVIGNVLSMLGALLAAITGFYFGGRTVEKEAEKRAEAGQASGQASGQAGQ